VAEPSLEIIGNKASEQGAYDEGADFSGINRSELQPMPEPITVTVERGEHHVTLIPEKPIMGDPEFRESAESITRAQIFDDPQASPATRAELQQRLNVAMESILRLNEITKRNPREQLCWFRLEGAKQDISCTGDRIIVRQDTTESVYTCRICKGKGHTDETCKRCDGKPDNCRDCLCVRWGSETPYSSGKVRCESCNGNGWSRGIIIPEIAQSVPVTGIVVSVGYDTVLCKLGDRVQFSRYAGQHLTMRNETLITMREAEVLNLMREAV